MNNFENIYSENYPAMVRVARKMVGNSDESKDIVQDIFIDLLNNLNKGAIINNPRSWLYRATTNRCVDNLRKRKNFSVSGFDNDIKTEDDITLDIYTKLLLDKALSGLKPRERVLVAFYSEGMSYKELSDATGIRFSSIGKLLSRALKKLEKELKELRYDLY